MVNKYFVVYGQPYVKKSNQTLQKRGGRTVKVNTDVFNRWLTKAYDQLAEYDYHASHGRINKQRRKLKQPPIPGEITTPINLQCRFYMATNGRVDLSALYEGIQDVLVEVGVLDDDNWHIVASHDGSGVCKDAAEPRIEITITDKETSL